MKVFRDSIDVLVIDDIRDVAKSCCDNLKLSLKVAVEFATNSNEAINFVNENTIKVIIFDYNMMSDINGIQIYQKLRKIDSDFKAILFTIETGKGEIFTEAKDLGFSEIMIKGRNDYSLQFRVMTLLNEYGLEKFPTARLSPFFTVRIGGILSKNYIYYFIQPQAVQFFEYDEKDVWQQSEELYAGDKKEISIENEFAENLEFSRSLTFSSSVDLESKLGLPKLSVAEFNTKFSSALEQVISSSHKQSTNTKTTKTWTRELPRDGKIVYERHEYTLEYKVARIFILAEFSWTKKKDVDWLEVVVPTGAYKRRIYQRLSNDDSKYIDLPPNRLPSDLVSTPQP